jgi:Protein of unknown function (DUF3301)
MLSFNLIFLLVAAIAAVLFWHRSLNARERANQAAMAACTRMGLQFLDGTVAFARLSFSFAKKRRPQLRRTYVFDYTATSFMDSGSERRQGFVIMAGAEVESIGFAPNHEESREAIKLASNGPMTIQTPAAAPPAAREPDPASNGKVLDLAEWRRKHRSGSAAAKDPSRNTWQ